MDSLVELWVAWRVAKMAGQRAISMAVKLDVKLVGVMVAK